MCKETTLSAARRCIGTPGAILAAAIMFALVASIPASGQGIRQGLTIQGLDQPVGAGSRARAMGQAFTAISDDATGMFWNPAGLVEVSKPSVSIGYGYGDTKHEEAQRWNPDRYYAGLSLYFQNEVEYANEPLDDPDWSESEGGLQLNHAAFVVPFTAGEWTGSVAVGYRQIANLNDFDRNENVLDPYIGNFRPAPIPRPNPGDSVSVTWSSFERERTGTLNAYSAAIGVNLMTSVNLGVRAEVLRGSSDDRQRDVIRGVFSLYDSAHRFSYYPGIMTTSWSGTSDYSGVGLSAGLKVVRERFSVGAQVTLPTEITRDWTQTGDVEREGSDVITLPAAYTLGIVIRPSSAIRVSADYKLQDLSELDGYTDDPSGLPAWYAVNGLSIGAEWDVRPALALRAGYREDPRPYRVTGAGIVDETSRGSVYALGAGYQAGPVSVDVVYEYHSLLLIDRWESNVNYQNTSGHQAILTIGFEL